MLTAVETNYLNDLESDSGWVRMKTKVKMFFSGYEIDELKNDSNLKIFEQQPIQQSFTATRKEASVPMINQTHTPSQAPMIMQEFDHFPNREEACIPKDTIMEGSISTKSNLLICGFVRGDIVSENNITITGRVEGNLQAKSIHVNKGTIDGHINCIGDVNVSELSIVTGNIDSQSLECNGEIKGDIKTSKSVSLKSGALVHGSVLTKSISMQDGSILRGNVEMPMERTTMA